MEVFEIENAEKWKSVRKIFKEYKYFVRFTVSMMKEIGIKYQIYMPVLSESDAVSLCSWLRKNKPQFKYLSYGHYTKYTPHSTYRNNITTIVVNVPKWRQLSKIK